jgi:hypothetical protein
LYFIVLKKYFDVFCALQIMNKKVKISGVTIVKNAIDFDYPIMECIQSLLPIVDEMIISIGDGKDNTEEVIKTIKNDKIKIVHSVWDNTIKTGGSVLAVETNKAIKEVSKDSDWLFYLQADEVIHEQDYIKIVEACERYKNDDRVQGLLFRYHHFYGSFNYVGDSRRWYNHEIRIIKNNIGVQSYRDAQGFRMNDKKLRVKKIDAFIYHYGWVRNPNAQLKKIANFDLYWGAETVKEVQQNELFDYMQKADSLEKYAGTHPAIMQQRIAAKNWELHVDTKTKRFSKKDYLLYKFEKLTGIRLFDYKNYTVI